jgi:C4-dicarboxylate-binding protein DctP
MREPKGAPDPIRTAAPRESGASIIGPKMMMKSDLGGSRTGRVTQRSVSGAKENFMRLIAFLLLAATLAAQTGARAEPVLLRVSLQDSVKNPLNQSLLDFKKGVETRTKGAVAVQIFDQSQFYNDYQVPGAVGSGAIEMGLAPLGQYAGEIPAAGVFLQPFLFNFDEIIRAAAQPGSEIRTIIDNEILSQTGARVLWWQRYGSPVLLSKDQPMHSPVAMANKNVRAFDELTGEVIKLCGGKPHVIADSKQAEAFNLDIIDSNLTDISSVKAQELWRRTKFITRIRLSEILYAVIINEDIWAGLSKPQQQILVEEAAKVEKAIWSRFAQIEGQAYSFAAEKGMKVEELTSHDIVNWRVCSSSVLESYMTKAGTMGEQLMGAYARLRLSPCCNKVSNAAPNP